MIRTTLEFFNYQLISISNKEIVNFEDTLPLKESKQQAGVDAGNKTLHFTSVWAEKNGTICKALLQLSYMKSSFQVWSIEPVNDL